ncbi:MAG: hypothetical protein ACREYA_32370 [Cupriavidus necator]
MTNMQGARSLAEMWNVFRAGAIPPQAPDYQIDSMRDAFFGGAWSFSQLLTQAQARDGAVGVCNMLDIIHDELNEHTMATVRAVRVSAEEAEVVLALVKRGVPLTDAEEAYVRSLLARDDDDDEPPNCTR